MSAESMETPGEPIDSALVVSHWRRYGKDRLYVERPDGTKVGWWDLTTEQAHPESEEVRAVLADAVAGWKSTPPTRTAKAPATAPPQLVPEVVPDVVPDVVPEVVPDVVPDEVPERVPDPPQPQPAASHRPWIDLATNRPGAAAREQAVSAKNAAPVRTILARALGVHTDERAWRIGADGEEKVASQLEKAAKRDPRWRFVHAIPVGTRGSDIDHLIIGPGGVFTANAKHHPQAKIWVGGNTFLVNGTKQPYIRNSRHEAERAGRLLTDVCGFPVHVEGLIVTVNASDVTVKTPSVGVQVVPRMQVAKWLLRHGEILGPETIHAIHEAARRSTTWVP